MTFCYWNQMEDVFVLKSGSLGADCFVYLFLLHNEIAPHSVMLCVYMHGYW
jgi:hypothetical protein